MKFLEGYNPRDKRLLDTEGVLDLGTGDIIYSNIKSASATTPSEQKYFFTILLLFAWCHN